MPEGIQPPPGGHMTAHTVLRWNHIRIHSQPRKEVVNGHLQGGGNTHERIDRNGLLAALDLTDVVTVQVGLLRQGFLRIADAFTVRADRLADDLAVFGTGGGHAPYGNRRPRLLLPPIACILDLQFGRFLSALSGN